MAGQRFTTRLRRSTSIVAGFLTLFVLTLACAPRAEAFVYWADFPTGTIGRANLDGTGVDKRFITRTGDRDVFLDGVAVDAAHVYWVDISNGTIGRANLDGTGADPSFITGLDFLGGVAVDAAHVYWTNRYTGAIGRTNLDGTGADPSFITGLGSLPGAVAVDAAHVYWSDSAAPGPDSVAAIGRANLDGTGIDRRFFITALSSPIGVAVDAAHVYWTTDTGAIGRANLDGTGVEPSFLTGVLGDFLGGVAVDAAHVYWADVGLDYSVGTGGIGRASLDGTGADPDFITGADASTRSRTIRPTGVAVDPLRSFSFGKVKRNKQKGTAKLTLKVPGPGTLKLAKTENVKGSEERAEAKGKEKLPVRAKGEMKTILKRKGKAKVTAEVTYTPASDDANIVADTDSKKIQLIKR